MSYPERVVVSASIKRHATPRSPQVSGRHSRLDDVNALRNSELAACGPDDPQPAIEGKPMLSDAAVNKRTAISRIIRAAAAGAIGLAAAGGLAAFAGPAQAAGWPGTAGAVYTMTNAPGGNAIEAYARASDGTLTRVGTYPTGGDGGTLDSGHSIAVSRDGRVVVNVNAGSNSISAFAATPRGLHLIGTASSGGTDPDSVTIAGDRLVYALNAGSQTIAGFRLGGRGLRPIPGSVQPLGAGALVPKQIQFGADARVLVVDESGSSTIDTFVVGRDGTAGPAVTTPSVGGGPFGFDFDRAGYLLVSDAALSTGQSGATSYDVAQDGAVTANGPAVPIDQAAACWLAAAGGFAYTANAGSGSIGRYAIATDGALTALGSTLVENDPTAKPLDEGVSGGQNYLYVLAGGLAQIVGYQVGAGGSLTQVTTAPVAAGSVGIGAS
jgi:6-phosphogluconolactonase